MRGRKKELETHDGQLQHFLKKITKSSNCWLWSGRISPLGYGSHTFFGKPWQAHRLAYHLLIGPFDLDLDVCHTCDVPACVNPSHLWLGTAKDNIADMMRKGRNKSVKGEANPRAKLTEDIVREMRKQFKNGKHYKAIAKEFNVNPYTVNNIVLGWSWKHIKESI